MSVIAGFVKFLVALAMILVVVGVGAFIFTRVNINLNPGSSKSTQSSPVQFDVKPGDSVTKVAENLQQAGLIDSTFFFRVQLKLKGAESQLKAGRFQLHKGMSNDELISALTTAPAEVGLKFQVTEGKRISEIAEELGSRGVVTPENFLKLAATAEGAASFEDDFLKTSGRPADQGLEGYLFPDTYEIKQGEGDNSETVIKEMLGNFEAKVTPEMRQKVADRGLTMHKVLTIASIVQREGVVKEELPVIAAVFWNRVEAGMRLDADPTTQYAVGKPGDWWPVLRLDPNTVDHPYNTYKIAGMPPGPICNPGIDAIAGAISPDENDYLYFVAKNDGTGAHAFAKTLEEHERNRVLYGNR